MVLSGRLLLLMLSIVVAAAGIVMYLEPESRWLALVVAACAVLSLLILNIYRPPAAARGDDPEVIEDLPEERQRELVRGTSLHLREMRYRYSVRIDPSERTAFSTEVNTVPIGFIPVIITDNTDDRQGYGYVAFVFDGERWRGPGLPCSGTPEDAVEHAGKCISPLE